MKEKRESLQTSSVASFGILRKETKCGNMKITAKLIKTNRSQNSCRISPSEQKLTLALEDKTGSQMLHEMILQKLKHLVGRWRLRINFLFPSYVFCYCYYFIPPFRIWANFPPFRLLGFAAIFRHSVF